MIEKDERRLTGPLSGRQIRIGISIALAVFILVSSAAYLLFTNLNERKSSRDAKGGFLDLRNLDLQKERWIELNGEWQFYPGQLLQPSEGGIHDPKMTAGGDPAHIMSVPGPWELPEGPDGSSRGFGSYRLVIALSQEGVYGLRTKTVRSACRVFINGRQVAGMGKVAGDASAYQPMSRYCSGFMQSRDRKVEVIIHVANFYNSKGGILSPIEFGPAESVVTRINREISFEAIVVFSFLLAGILSFFFYLMKRQNRHLLDFSLGCFFISLHLSVMNNQILTLVFDLSFSGRIRVLSIATVGVICCFLAFVQHFFHTLANRKVCLAIKSFMLLELLVIVANPRWLLASAREALQTSLSLGMLASFAYMAYIMVKAMMRKIVAVEFILVAVVSLASYGFSLMVKVLLDWKMTYYSEWMLLFVLVSMASLIGDRLHKDYLEMVGLTDERLGREFDYFFSQISPHFIYNTINTIIALSYEDSEKTRTALNHLAMYFRGKLNFHKQKGLVPLETELETVVAYLEIEKMRYEDKLRVEYAIEPDLDCMIPPLTIQPLAENAIRHGIASLETIGTVRITAGKTGDGFIRTTVEDDGVGMPSETREEVLRGTSTRLGLWNIIKKIDLIPGASIHIEGGHGQGTLVTLILPEGGIHADHESDSR